MKIDSKNLTDDIAEARPNLKTNTVKQYVTNLNKLKNMFDTDNYDFLSDTDKVMEKVSDLHYLSQRNILNAVVVLLMALNSDEKYDKLLEEYGKLRDELNDKYSDEQKSGVISDKQSKNFATIEEVYDMINKMGTELQPIKKKTELTKKDFSLLQAFTLFNIYARMPMRNDVSEMEAIKKSAYNKLSADEKKSKNYLVLDKNGMFFVLNKYKTVKKYEELNLPIDDKALKKIIRYYLKHNGMGVMFKTSTGKPITRTELSKLLIKFSKKYMNKSVSTTILRKSYLSSKYGDIKKEMAKDSKVLGHDVATTGMKVYVKEAQ
jgi:integrase